MIPDALLVNKNMLQIDMRSTASKLQLVMQPPLEKVSVGVRHEAGRRRLRQVGRRLEAAGSDARDKSGKIKVVLHGTFPKNCAKGYSINVVDRQDYVGRLFRGTWKKLGGAFGGDVIEGVAAPDARLLAEHASRALPEVVRDINKPSDNALARTVFLSLGSLEADPVLGSRPIAVASADTTFARADLAVRNWMRQHGIDDAGLVMENGSGLSRLERISAGADGRPAEGRPAQRLVARVPGQHADRRGRRHHAQAPEGQPGRRPCAHEDRHAVERGGGCRLRARRAAASNAWWWR